MSRTTTHCLLIALVSAFVFFANLGATRLWDDDETIYASCAREMLARGDWVVPYYNGQVFYDKPPLVFWSIMAGFGLFGQTEFAARFCSALLGVATCLLTYLFGRRLFGSGAGLWAGLIAASTIVFTISARAATVDMALTFFTTASMYLFAVVAMPKRLPSASGRCWPAADPPTGSELQPPGWLLWAGIYCCLGIAMLAKGPVGVLLPCCAMAFWLLVFRYAGGVHEPTLDQPEVACQPRQSATTGHRPCASPAAESPAEVRKWYWPVRLPEYLAFLRKTMLVLWRVFMPRNLLAVFTVMRPATAALVLALVALPWYVLVAVRTDGVWVQQFVAKYNVGPFLQPSLGHRGPVFYHFLMILVGFFPWSVFLGPTVVFVYRRLRSADADRWAYVLLSCWVGVFFVFWSACSTKLPHYVLPTYPALAMLTGSLLADWLAAVGKATVDARGRAAAGAATNGLPVPSAASAHPRGYCGAGLPNHLTAVGGHPLGPGALRRAVITLVLVGVGLLVGVPIVASEFVPGEEAISLVGLIPLGGAAISAFCLRRADARRMLGGFAVASVLFVSSIFAWAAVRVDRHQHAPKLLAAARSDCGAEPHLVGYRYLQPSVVYYAARPVPCAETPQQLLQSLGDRGHSYVITTQVHAEQLLDEMPGLQVVAAQPRFLKRGQVVLILRADDGFIAARTAGRIGDKQSSTQR